MNVDVVAGSRILLVEDERDLAEPVLRSLREDGFEAAHAPNGETARRLLEQHWDVVILDLMLPDIPGEALLTYLRQKIDFPNVLVLTAKTGLQDKLKLFRLGCDDYMTKPYIYDELIERVRALLRRAPRVATEEYRYGDLELNPVTYELSSDEDSVTLTPKEAAICRILLSQPERIVARREILQGVWGLKEEPNSNFIGVHIFNLRKKLAQLGREAWFQTVRTTGFVLCDPKSAAYGS